MNSHDKISRVTGWGAAALCLSISLASAVPALARQTVVASAPAVADAPGESHRAMAREIFIRHPEYRRHAGKDRGRLYRRAR
ncbi:hypothetical protein QZM99_31275, partial [Burkholderia gladioli]|uniref:hypothetical protein n=1 Tax=Burkholderia gladioli TaxID=28095 RepID=UPI00265132F8